MPLPGPPAHLSNTSDLLPRAVSGRTLAGVTWGAPGMRMAVVGLIAAAMLAGAVPTHGVLEGENGRIVFISGRAPQTDATARAYLLPVPSNTVGGGRLSDPITPAGGQYRHPTWS